MCRRLKRGGAPVPIPPSEEEEGEAWEGQGEGYSAEYALWFLKNVCPLEGCGGTLAPPTTTADAMECNRCGCLRSDAQFYAELEA